MTKEFVSLKKVLMTYKFTTQSDVTRACHALGSRGLLIHVNVFPHLNQITIHHDNKPSDLAIQLIEAVIKNTGGFDVNHLLLDKIPIA